MTILSNGRTNGHTVEAAPPARSPKRTRSKVERHPVPLAVTLEAIARRESTRRHYLETLKQSGDDRAFHLWIGLAAVAYVAACEHLVDAILAWDPEADVCNPGTAHERYHLPRGVIHNGTLYLAIADDDERADLDEDPEGFVGKEGRCRGLMKLAVIEMSNVEDLDAVRG